jgi:hypothetical protein
MQKKLLISLTAFLFFSSLIKAQDPMAWWNTIHQWDGHTHWTRYLTIAPAYLGPNALPVPEIRPAGLPSNPELQLSLEGHFSKGDNTQDLFAEIYHPIGNFAGLRIYSAAVEHYVTDTLTRDLRASREKDPRGVSFGDIYVSTEILLRKDKEKGPDIMLGIHLRTASGDKLKGARHTDTPGYHFDMTFSRTIERPDRKIKEITPFAQAGFYVWQMLRDNLLQNDAPSYGLGIEAASEKLRIRAAAGGYAGYLGDGDQPLVGRFDLWYDLKEGLRLNLRYQEGIHDFPYRSLRAGILMDMKRNRR